MKATIVIPTYWRGPVAEDPECTLESDFTYDHATPLDAEGTLGRALASLSVLKSDHEFAVAVVATSTRRELTQAVELKARSIVAQYDYNFPLVLVGPDEMVAWRRRLAEAGYPQYDDFLSLEGYANVRNICLLAAMMTGADVAILFDDDQVYEDPQFLDKALEFVGREIEGKFIGGVAGTYIQENGEPYLPHEKTEWQRQWGKFFSMNEMLKLMEKPPRLKKTPVVFGGNMVIHRSIFETVPFDPQVPRGEDIDYLMNARFFGHDFMFDNELLIKHLPPPKCAPEWHRLRLDIIRFAREKAKLESQRQGNGIYPVKAEDFDPYPGRFLKDGLHDLVFRTSMEMATDYLKKGMDRDAEECMINIAISKAESNFKGDPFGDYLIYQRKWREFVETLPRIDIWQPEEGVN